MKSYRIKQLFKLSIIKTVYFNFRLLPVRQAIKLPIFIYRRFEIGKTGGKIIFEVPPRTGLVQFGFIGSDFIANHCWGQIYIDGTMQIAGKVDFGIGSQIRVYKGGEVSIGNNVQIAALTKLLCENNIEIGNNVRIAHECQIMDSNFHYVEDVESKKVECCSGTIHIGNDNWVANRSTIQKGTITPDFCIVGANSVLNKDYSKICPSFSLIAGTPAKLIKTGVRRILDFDEEAKWDKFYGRRGH